MFMIKIKFSLIILVFVIIASCKKENDVIIQNANLELISTYSLNIPEPSDLTFDKEKGVLYTVSDETKQIYKITTEGAVLQIFNVNADDLEGVTIYNESNLLLVDEATNKIINYNLLNNTQTSTQINYNNTENKGLEGVCFNKTKNAIYIVNEKEQGALLELDTNFTIKTTKILTFAKDYSAVYFDEKNNVLWIVSDESATINKCTTEGKLIKTYNINIENCEGVAIDFAKNNMYFVSDSESKLYKYKMINL